MLSFHSIAPVRLTQATEKRPPPKPKPNQPSVVMTDTEVASRSAVPGAIDAHEAAHMKDLKAERAPVAKLNAHNGKRVSLSALHSAAIRGCIWASEKRKGDDDGAVFIGRIQPETVTHLVMIHPWALSADQTPEEILKTFRAQISASKASSIVKIINRKMGPEPKTLQISPKAIIDGTRGPRASESSEEEEEVVVGVTETEQPQASRRERIRASFDSAKLRNPVATLKSQINQRGRKRHRDGSPSAATPDAAENAEPATDLTEGELEHHSEEESPDGAGLVSAEGETFMGRQLGEIPEEGFLEHFEEEIVEETPEEAAGVANQSDGGLFAGSTDGAGGAGQDTQGSENAKNGSQFQLTFYPSPAMDIMARYVQESCHVANGHAFPTPTAAPTAAGVLASIGWEPEKRVLDDADQQLEDENWQAREIEEDLAAISAKAARSWDKQCRKYVKQSKGGRLGGEKKSGRFAILAARVQTRKPGKGKTREDQPEEPPEKNGKAAALKQRLAAIKEKRSKTKKQEATEADPTKKQSKKEKAQKASGVILFPVILILGIPILIGKGIATGFKKIRDRKPKKDGDAEDTEQQQGQPQAKPGRRVAMKQRLSERSGSVKQGLNTRSDAIKKRLAARKAKKADAGDATTTDTPPDGQADTAAQSEAGAATTQTRLTKKQRLTSLLFAGPLAVKSALDKRRQGKDKSTPATPDDATPKEKKASKFAGAKERVKSLRTKVNKQARFAKLKARLRVLKERRKNRKNSKKNTTDNDPAPGAEVDDNDNTTSAKKHGAIAGLVAGCVALPAAKVKQARDKRRRGKAADVVEGVAAAAREEHATASNPSVAAAATNATPAAEEGESASLASRPSGMRLVPSEPEMQESAADQFSPPENGQSEVPIQQAARSEPALVPESRGGDVDVAAAAAASGNGEDHAERPAAAVRFKSIRDGFGNVRGGIGSGITNLKARRRGAGQGETPVAGEAERPQAETMDSAETHVEADPSTVEPIPQSTAAQRDAAASGGRFKFITDGIGSGIEGLKARKQREKKEVPQADEPAATTAAAEEEKRTAAANKDTAFGGRLKALKDGIGSRGAKLGETGMDEPVKTEKSKQQKPQTNKDWNSGLMDRMKWFLYAA
ncbi:putative secreted [Diaporthe ampelina]|uniref:Putative secreted n=1 Tax=Diaporthe ampelina TaxID=1214573 RepID=A0A0G2F941_9PEZI|nr:putative secreted [Diaporthe ampelina]